ncbi:MAG: hypothetical protein AAB428_01455 [Patescibacteria group bacterium]
MRTLGKIAVKVLVVFIALTGCQLTPLAVKSAYAQAIPSTRVQDFIFDVVWCRKQETQVTCRLLVTNQTEDRSISLETPKIKLYGDIGDVYDASIVRLGNQQGSAVNNFKLPLRIPIQAELRFDKVDPDMKGVAMLDILFTATTRAGSMGYYSAQIRDIPLLK